MSSIQTLLENNATYAARFSHGDLAIPPRLQIAIVACMDARLQTGALLGLREGDAHVIRNAGGIVTEDVLRSLALSQHFLGTREIMLIHHTDCGMFRFTDAEVKDAIEKATRVRPSFAMGAFSDLEDGIRQSLARVRECPFLLHKDAVRGFVCEVKTGRLREVE